MRAGLLRHKIRVVQPTRTMTGKGDANIVYDYNIYTEEWASIEPIIGRELLYAKSLRPDLSHKITMRHRPDITNRTVFVWNNGVRDVKFHISPEVSTDYKLVQAQYYAYEIR